MIISRKGKEYNDKLKGYVWVFPDNVDTDAISPSQYINDPKEMAKHTCETTHSNTKNPKKLNCFRIIFSFIEFLKVSLWVLK